MNVLQQYNLTSRPVVRRHGVGVEGVSASEGVVIHFSRKLPSDILKKPKGVSGYATMIREREEEFEPELPVEGKGSASGGVAAAAAESKKDTGVFIDKRHTADIDRAAIMAKLRGTGSRVVVPIMPPSFSSKFVASSGDEGVRRSEMEPDFGSEISNVATAPIKLGKRAFLPSDEPVKQSKASAAMAIADVNEDMEFEEMRPLASEASEAAAMGETGAEGASAKMRVIRPKPKGVAATASGSVSAAAASVKSVVKKIKEREDSTVNIAAYKIGDTVVATRLPVPRPLPQVQASEFYMNNRAKFIQYINALFRPYREELTSGENDISCESLYGGDDSASVALLTHQKIVRDYLNIYSPYRGLLLFHGLGSGKTCSSIAIAEGLKTFKKIVVMTPASLRMNYIEEMKTKCGDLMYKKNQYWEFIESRGNPELTRVLSQILMLADDKFVRSNGGAWMVNVTKPSNYETELTPSQRVRVDRQIDEMINAKYEFINYNGLRAEKLKSMTEGYTHNPFDNSVVIIDEAHNFVSRIVNKLKRPTSMAYRLYHFLLSAQNAKVVLLTGTPIINYPNEIGVLFNILRGNIDNWVFTIGEAGGGGRLTIDTFKSIFGLAGGAGAASGRSGGKGAAASSATRFANGIGLSFDHMDYNTRTKNLMITRNPFGFVRDYDPVSAKYRGIVRRGDPSAEMSEKSPVAAAGAAGGGVEASISVMDSTSTENGLLSDAAFERAIVQKLRENGISVISASTNKQTPFTALPDKMDEFNGYFIDPATLEFKNRDLFIRRILGLTSYFRSAQEKLLPIYDSATNFHLVEVEMSDYQFAIYSRVRDLERTQESNMKKKAKKRGAAAGAGKKAGEGGGGGDGIYDDVSSTYRIFSRAFCNFVFPPSIRRPLPGDDGTAATEIEKSAALGRMPDAGAMGEAHETAEMLAARIARSMETGGGAGVGAAKRGRKPKGAAGAAGAAASGGDESERMDENMLDGEGAEESEDESEMVITGEHSDAVAAVMAGTSKKQPATSSKKEYVAQYQASITKAIRDLKVSAGSFLIPEELATYSPKFLHLLQNILDKQHVGLHLVYSQFRTLEGIGIIKLILETNGFSQFKIKQSSLGDWTIDMSPEEQERPCFALYTGTETPEEKEIIRNIFNSKWKNVPKSITDQLNARTTNNMFGEVIKILMITASGAEGINLRNVRYVHITEPYWHPVRTEQIIGRARRICSHIDLPEELRTVDVFLYLMRFTARQVATENDESLNIRMHDKSKTDGTTPMSTDQSLYEISNIKERITRQILTAVKESSFDCMIHANAGSKERLQCYSFGMGTGEESLAYQPNIATEEDDKTQKLNKQTKTVALRKLVVNGKEYAEDPDTHIIYDLELYKMGSMIERGRRTIIPADPRTGTGEQSRVEFL
jgi:SNF2-related domain/Helicase conserved C-terminal domain